MNLERLDLEKYEQLEMERNNTIADKQFQQWMSELNVSQSYEDRGGIVRANELNAQYDYSRSNSKGSIVTNVINLFR
jgi:hypothetical protein